MKIRIISILAILALAFCTRSSAENTAPISPNDPANYSMTISYTSLSIMADGYEAKRDSFNWMADIYDMFGDSDFATAYRYLAHENDGRAMMCREFMAAINNAINPTQSSQ